MGSAAHDLLLLSEVPMRRLALLLGGTAAAALIGSSLAPVTADATGVAARPGVHTPFAFTAGAFGTQVKGGDIPAGSDQTAYANISCRNRAGLERTNHIASVTLSGLGAVDGVDSRVWTTARSGTYAAHSFHRIAGITLAQTALGKLAITGVESRARAWHDATGFHADSSTSLGGLTLTLPTGKQLTLKLPTIGNPVTVPGVLKLEMGRTVREQDRHHVLIRASTLKITLIATNTEVRVAQTRAGISDGIQSGLFGGFGAALRASVLAPVVSIGKTPNQPMPCRGTDGVVRTRGTAGVNVPAVASVTGLADTQMADQTATKAWGWQRAEVAGVSLLGGRVKVTGVRGQVNVRRTPDGLKRNTNGTRTLAVTLDGNELALPDLGKVLTIPGLLTLQQHVVTKIDGGLQVIALQLKLLDGTGATVDLGVAKLRVLRG
jgi:hypothetical protein